jgi:hypothetical protein
MNLVERVGSPIGAIAHAQPSFDATDATYERLTCGLAPRA